MEEFYSFVAQPNQRFRCYVYNNEDAGKWIANIYHELYPPASEIDLHSFQDEKGITLPQSIIDFYLKNNGFVLYSDTLSYTAGIELAPVQKWNALIEDARDWFGIMMEGIDDEEAQLLKEEGRIPTWLDDAIAIGRPPHSGNFYLLVLAGESPGSIFYFNHDGFEFELFADSFEDFLLKIITDPVELLTDIGCFATYSDGKTNYQWIPEAFAVGDEAL